MRKKLYLLFLFLFALFAQAQTSTFYNFNTQGDLTNYFTRGNTGYTQVSQSTNTGISGSGAVFIGNTSANEVYTTKQGYSNGGVGSVYEFSSFVKSEFNAGYSAIGFTSVPNQVHSNSGNPAICLGVSVHGGGFIFFNNSSQNSGSWQSGGVVNASMFDLLNNGSPDKWYKIVLKITAQANNNYHLRLEVWPSNASGVLLYSSPSAVQERIYQNNNIGNSTVLYSYFGFGGYRVSNFDNYSMNLQGSTVINQGAPVVVNGTAILSPILNNSIDIDGNVTDDRDFSVSDKGFVWNTSGSPTISDNKKSYGSGEGSFNGTINNLSPGTYYLRAYAINSNGVSYGTERIVVVPVQTGLITTDKSNLQFDLCSGDSSLTKSFTVSATNIGSSITLGSVTGFSYSLDNVNFYSSLNINAVSGQVNTTTVYVKFTNIANTSSNGILSVSATSALGRSVSLSGNIVSNIITQQPVITNAKVCKNSTSQTINVVSQGATAYQWYQNDSNSISGAVLIAGANSASYNLPTSLLGTKYYFVKVSAGQCDFYSNIVSQTIVNPIVSISAISGTNNLLSNATSATYSVTPVSGVESYIWDLPSGMTLTSQTGPSVTVAISSAFTSGTIRVKALNACGESVQSSLVITKAPLVSFALTGSTTLCPGTQQVYTATSVSGGNYVWTVPSTATIVSGQGTNSLTIAPTASFVSGQVKVVCTTGTSTQQATIMVSGATQPSTITGPTNICGLTTATYSVVSSSGFSYQWTLPQGMSITSGENTSSITVSISGGVSGSISVRSVSACGISLPRTVSVGSSPILGTISGSTIVCGAVQTTIDTNGQVLNSNPSNQYTYKVPLVPGVTSYQWSVPTGATLVSGQGSNIILVSYDLSSFNSGIISVQGVNSCGTGVARTLSVSTVSGSISGPATICGLTTATYSVPSDLGNNFVWTLPQGMTITGGSGTSSITVGITHPIDFASGNQVSVSFTTACGGSKTLNFTVSCNEYTKLTASYCGATSISPSQWLFVTSVSGATSYKYNVYDATGTNLVFSTERSVTYFRFLEHTFTYGATYQVRVQAKIGGIYGIEGVACSVTIQDANAALQSAYCGATNVTPYQWLFVNNVVGATAYKYNVYDATGTNLVFSTERSVNFFRFLENTFAYGTTYQVRVQVKQGDSYGVEGSACSVTIQGLPTTSLATSSCGASNVTPYQILFVNSVAGATGYKYNVYDEAGTTMLFSIESGTPSFRFLNSPFVYGQIYQVKVQVKQGNTYGSEGSSCSVLLSKMPITSLVASQCNSTISTASDIIYATAVAGVTTYRFTIYDSNSNQVAQIERPNNYFKLNDFAYVPGVTYSVAVATKQEGQSYGLNGGLCTVSTPAPVVRVTAIDQSHKVHVSNVESIKVYPNPFQSGFVIVPIASDLGAKVSYEVFDLTGKLIESNELSVEVIQNYTIGQEYARGMYIVNITQGTSSQSFKMIKQ
ncbi:T9SS type A sorting domain-containing protein [Flavobacterium sp.]|jgi:hypothetical protein|uniref:T9SS type A sorting domain-containing protein n=2 Tax=Flavobacterium sp. TaxID=239 RepID=UPI0037BFA721